MEIEKFNRKTFEVEAVQISLDTIEDIAAWCGGIIEKRPVKMMGTTALLPVVSLKGSGVEHGKFFYGHLNCWVVKMNKTFRIYKPEQFERTFTKVEDNELERTRDLLATAEAMLNTLGFELPREKHTIIIENLKPLSPQVNDAIDQALEIAKNEVEAHNSECEV